MASSVIAGASVAGALAVATVASPGVLFGSVVVAVGGSTYLAFQRARAFDHWTMRRHNKTIERIRQQYALNERAQKETQELKKSMNPIEWPTPAELAAAMQKVRYDDEDPKVYIAIC